MIYYELTAICIEEILGKVRVGTLKNIPYICMAKKAYSFEISKSM